MTQLNFPMQVKNNQNWIGNWNKVWPIAYLLIDLCLDVGSQNNIICSVKVIVQIFWVLKLVIYLLHQLIRVKRKIRIYKEQ